MIELDDVDVSIDGTPILREVSATVDDGTFVGLIGPNGAGKSTLLRTTCGILAPTRGTVNVDGRNVHSLTSRETSRLVAVVPQDTRLGFDFTVREVVSMGRTPYLGRFSGTTATDRKHVDRALERTETAHLADRSIRAVSGGERQRIVLARALAQDAPILLLDEPTASLDINHQVRTLELVSDLVSEGRTALAAIHDLNLAAHYCDKLLLLGSGRVLATGSPSAVLTEDLLARAFDTHAIVTRHPVTGSVYVTALPDRPIGGRGRVHVIGGGGNASQLLYVLSAAGYDVSVGVLNEGDSDLETARILGIDAITVDPFSPVDESTLRSVTDRIRNADATVLADIEVGPANVGNLSCARASDHLVVVEDRPFSDRNFAGADARDRYETLRAGGTVVSSSDVVDAVADGLTEPAEGKTQTDATSGETHSPTEFREQREAPVTDEEGF